MLTLQNLMSVCPKNKLGNLKKSRKWLRKYGIPAFLDPSSGLQTMTENDINKYNQLILRLQTK